VMTALKQQCSSFLFASRELQNDQEVFWMSKKYCKLIRSIEMFDLNFHFVE
jgi:hypothetical protein